jgi:hypothetical protein
MFESEAERDSTAPGADPSRVAWEFRERVLPCGVEAVNRLEAAVSEKLASVLALEQASPEAFPPAFREVVEGVATTRPYRTGICVRTEPEVVRGILAGVREGRLGAAVLPYVTEQLAGAPLEVRTDLASELLHAGAPDRIALLARWVSNPARQTGILSAYGGFPPETYAGTQARLGEVRFQLGAVGFPSPTFAAVDVLLALSYAGRMGAATETTFHGGGIERLLPGPYPFAAMLLGVRRRLTHADR